MDPKIQQIGTEFKNQLQQVYGDELAELILFGSYARGDQHAESDVDFAVVFRDGHVRSLNDSINTSRLASRLSLRFGLMVSPLTTNLHTKESSMAGVYQEIRKQGIVI